MLLIPLGLDQSRGDQIDNANKGPLDLIDQIVLIKSDNARILNLKGM